MNSRKLSYDEIDAIHAVVARHGGYTKGLIPEMFAALAKQAQPKCEPCNDARMWHCSDPLHCGGPWSDQQAQPLTASEIGAIKLALLGDVYAGDEVGETLRALVARLDKNP